GDSMIGGERDRHALTLERDAGHRYIVVPAFAGTTENVVAAAAGCIVPRDLLEAGDRFVDALVDRHLLAHYPVHRLGPDVLVVQDRELPVLGEVERHRAAGELGVDGFPRAVSLPERALLARGRHREPTAERALDIGTKVILLHQEAH